MSFKSVKKENVNVKMVGVRPLNNKFMMATVVVMENKENGRVLEDVVVMPLESFGNDKLNMAMDETLKKFFGKVDSVVTVDKSVDKVVLEEGAAVKVKTDLKVKIGDTELPPETVEKIPVVKKKARKKRALKPKEVVVPENPFKEDDVLDVIVPKVYYDPKNPTHKAALNQAVADLFGDEWRKNKELKDSVMAAVPPLKKMKCLHENGTILEETLEYFKKEVKHANGQTK